MVDRDSIGESILANARLASTPAGLLVPQLGAPVTIPPAPPPPEAGFLRYVHEYMNVDHYMPSPPDGVYLEERRKEAVYLLNLHDRATMLRALGKLSLTARNPQYLPALATDFHTFLEQLPGPGQYAQRFATAYSSIGDFGLLSRQSLLLGWRTALSTPEIPPSTTTPPPPVFVALMLIHTLAAMMQRRVATPSSSTLGGIPEDLALEMIRNQEFNKTEDLFAAMDRTIRLWKDYGPAAAHHVGGRQPTDLLKVATGIELENFFALGFALLAAMGQWSPESSSVALADDFGADIDDTIKESFLRAVANDRAGFATAFAGSAMGDWDFVEFQSHPVLHLDDGLIVVDAVSLMRRFTTGLYWLVHDHLKATEGDVGRGAWNKTWGQMVEEMAEDSLSAHLPAALGTGTTFYAEEDLERAYPTTRRSDVLIDTGEAFGAFEVVSGQLTVPTRVGGNRNAFNRDMKKLAFEKIEQLDDTARNLIENESALTGITQPAPREVQPVIVAGGGFPVSLPVMNHIREWCTTHRRLLDPRIRPLGIIEPSELEMLEGFAEHGINPLDVIRDWQLSDLANISLRNFMYEQWPYDPGLYRPSRMRPRVEQLHQDMVARLKLRAP
jgi:hypothetical protein